MQKPKNEFPLAWPDSWPRTLSRTTSQFKSTLPAALKNVQEELNRFAKDSKKPIEGLMISSNVSLTKQNPDDTGVAVYFTWDGIPTCIAVDRYTKVEDNLQAIFRCIEAERTKMRHGGLNLVRASFRGYAALPPPSGQPARHWSDVLACSKGAPITAIEGHYKMLAKKYHPDSPGGSNAKMAELNGAWEQAKKEKGES